VETLRQTILPSNQAALRLAEIAFERGQLNILQVLQVHHAYVESITALLEATRAFADALAELEAAVGTPVQ
jgi:outer membrane protein TolC